MKGRIPNLTALTGAALALAACEALPEADPPSPMGFFVTSTGGGSGAGLDSLAGADAHCRTQAELADSGQRTWRACLSTNTANGGTQVHAPDRIGKGPWKNANGVVVAGSVDELHGNNHLDRQTALTQRGEVVNGGGDAPNQHDVLTGSTADGRAADARCGNWTLSGEGSAIVGHHDHAGLDDLAPAKSRIRRTRRAAAPRGPWRTRAATACVTALRSTDRHGPGRGGRAAQRPAR